MPEAPAASGQPPNLSRGSKAGRQPGRIRLHPLDNDDKRAQLPGFRVTSSWRSSTQSFLGPVHFQILRGSSARQGFRGEGRSRGGAAFIASQPRNGARANRPEHRKARSRPIRSGPAVPHWPLLAFGKSEEAHVHRHARHWPSLPDADSSFVSPEPMRPTSSLPVIAAATDDQPAQTVGAPRGQSAS